jgi:hypothetical protein
MPPPVKFGVDLLVMKLDPVGPVLSSNPPDHPLGLKLVETGVGYVSFG